jgi:low temperature requirement protein LtrA
LASPDHVRAYQQWLYSHLPLTMGIASLAVGIKRVIALAPHAMMPSQEAFMLSASAGVSMLSLNTIFLSSYPGKPPDAALRFVLPHYGLAVLTLATGFLAFTLSGIAVLGILTVLSILQILYSLRSLPDDVA